jgi:hypothetical protein
MTTVQYQTAKQRLYQSKLRVQEQDQEDVQVLQYLKFIMEKNEEFDLQINHIQ